MNPVWLVRSRQMITRFRFWLILSGYDPKDHSLTHKLYLVYASVFWSLWIFAVLTLAAGGVAGIFQSINPGHAVETAIFIEALVLFAWTLSSAFSAARRSPIVFSEEDAYLICQTPVDRRQVTLAWLVGDWPYSGIPFWVLGSILAFTLMEVRMNGHATFNNLPGYLFSAILCLSILVPLHFGILASIWAFGASRLQAEKDQAGLVWIPILIGVFISFAWALHSGLFGQPGPMVSLIELGLNPLLLPIQASLGAANWIVGELIAFVWVSLGIVWLAYQSINFNLSRAAQETSLHAAHRDAVSSLNQEAADEISIKQQLGVQQNPIHLPIPMGSEALIWKDAVQAIRGLRLSVIFTWIQLLGAAFGIFFVQDWALRLVSLFLWIMLSNQIFSKRLRLDLKNWAIFTQLPFEPLRLVFMEVSLPVIGSVFINWLALWLASRFLSSIQPIWMALLVPGVILGMALVTTWDILRQCESDALLAGVVPNVDIWSFVIGTIGILIPFGLLTGMVSSKVLPPLPYLGAFIANLMILIVLSQLVKNSYRKFK